MAGSLVTDQGKIMSTVQQQLFKTIVLHNKLMPESQLDALLRDNPDPEQAINVMAGTKVIPQQLGAQLLTLYRKKLEKAAATGNNPIPLAESQTVETPRAAPPPKPAAAATAPSVSVGNSPVDISKGGRELLHQILRMARDGNASDLHMKSGASPVIRVAAILRELPIPPIPFEVVKDTLVSVLTDTQRTRFLETNDLDFCYDAGVELGRFRTNFLSQHRGVDGIFRIINNHVPSFDELKLPEQIRRFCDYRQGIVLITGPKASGKTTTLAALVDLINATRAEHIITIEDPIEFVHKCKKGHVNQREVGPHTGSFSNALRAALREAPDVIMVGEMRDLETTSLAITAAETGHLVFGTLHTPDAVRTIGRVLDVFPPSEQGQIRAMFSESLRGIVSQLLIPNFDGTRMELANEILFNTPAIGNMIRESRAFQLRGSMQTGKKLGMVILDESIAKLCKEGKIAKEEAMVRAENQGYMEKELAGIH
jgi:twitching motility protein PilT